ncbi:unnamed protein product [Oncorhynchus mykiss]|uniref:Uncharacterized protein n=1 Tax=Oncorhynchus mykiss TaxID=8022 RepID=A0A060XGM1_ONCMY|nr:unnamed protein product [Oncorhynchus mykiss]
MFAVTYLVHVEIYFVSIENFCNSTSKDGFSFPRTPVGWSAYSEESCDEKTTSAGLPEASARCLNDTGSPMFGPPYILQCEFTLSDIQGNISSSSCDLLQLAFSTQILTSQPEQLSADNITTAAQIANTLLLSANITEDIAVAAVTTISQLLNASEESTQERDAVQKYWSVCVCAWVVVCVYVCTCASVFVCMGACTLMFFCVSLPASPRPWRSFHWTSTIMCPWWFSPTW